MKNPFIFGKVVRGEHFINRETEVAELTQTLYAGQNVICYSPRRYGKTSIMMRVKDNLEARGHLVFFIDLFRVTSLDDLYALYATSIAKAVRSPIKALIQTVQNILPTINPKIVFKSPESASVEISVPLPVLSKTETLHELFNSLEKYCGKKKKKGTVIFDEFQEVISLQDGTIIEREMRSAFQHHTGVSYAFLGSKHHLLKGIFQDKNRPFYNFGRHFDIDVIDGAHWRAFIAKHMGRMCSASTIEEIIRKTDNHPYYTQMYCHYLWEYSREHDRTIDGPILNAVMKGIIERDTVLLSELWDKVTIKERHFLKAIAFEQTGSVYEKKFLMNHNLGTASSVQKAVNKLIELDYIRKHASGKISFVNPLLKQWILCTDSNSKDLFEDR
jgi:hypothetical protein